MSKRNKEIIIRLIKKGEVFCAEVMAMEFGMSEKSFDKLVKKIGG